MVKPKKTDDLDQQIVDLTLDLQRTRADFENYRKRMESEKIAAVKTGEAKAILKLLPVVDTIERAVTHMPKDLAENQWAQGIAGLTKQLDNALNGLGLKRVEAVKGTEFNPELHEAIQFDENATGDKEVIDDELQAGYTLNGTPIRHAMVKVTRK